MAAPKTASAAAAAAAPAAGRAAIAAADSSLFPAADLSSFPVAADLSSFPFPAADPSCADSSLTPSTVSCARQRVRLALCAARRARTGVLALLSLHICHCFWALSRHAAWLSRSLDATQ